MDLQPLNLGGEKKIPDCMKLEVVSHAKLEAVYTCNNNFKKTMALSYKIRGTLSYRTGGSLSYKSGGSLSKNTRNLE